MKEPPQESTAAWSQASPQGAPADASEGELSSGGADAWQNRPGYGSAQGMTSSQQSPAGQQAAAAHPQPGTPHPMGQGAPYPPPGTPYPPPGAPSPTGRRQLSPTASKLLSPLTRGTTWRAMLIPPAIALGAGIVVSVILSLILMTMGDLDTLSQNIGVSTDRLGYALPFVLIALALFGSAAVRFDLQVDGFAAATGSLFVSGAPLVITGVVLGSLWWFSKRSELRSPSPNRGSTWIRIAISSLVLTIALFLLQLVFSARFSLVDSGGAAQLTFSAVTVRSFFLPLLVVAVTAAWGRVAGHFKGTEAIGAPFLRWAVPPALVVWIHLLAMIAVMSVVALFVLPLSLDAPAQTIPLLVVNMGLILTLLVHFGGISASVQGGFGPGEGAYSESMTIFSADAPGQLWFGLLAVGVAVLAATLVATVTRRPSWTVQGPDPREWHSAWRIPVTFAVAWGLLSLLAVPLRASMRGSAEAADLFGTMATAEAGVTPLAWSFLVFAMWGGLIEVLSRTLGPRLALTVPAVTKLLAGRAIHPQWGRALGMTAPRHPLIHRSAILPSAPPAAPRVPDGQDARTGASTPPGPGAVPGPNNPAAPGAAPVPGAAPGPNNPAGPGAAPGPNHPAGPSASTPPNAPAGPAGATVAMGAYPAMAGAHPAEGTAPSAPTVTPFDRRKATIIAVISGIAVLLLVAALIVVTQVNGRMFGPEAAVEKYLNSLSAGDAEGAMEIADVDVPTEQRQLLTNDILGEATALPSDISVASADVTGDQAVVSATFDLGGSKSTADFSLVRSGKTALFFDDWTLQSPELANLTVGTPGQSTVKVNGTDVDTDGTQVSLPAFPGLYSVELSETSDLVTADPVEARVFFAGSADATSDAEPPVLSAQPTDAFRAEVDKQVKTLVDSCATKTVAQPDGCPFGSYSAESYDATNIKWSISSYPSVTVGSNSASAYYAGDGTGPNGGPAWPITSESEGEAFITGDYESFFDDSATFDDTVTFAVDGTAEIVDGKIVITLSDGFDF